MTEMRGPKGLEEFALKCLKKLIILSPIEFKYPDECSLTNWPVEDIKTCNVEVLSNLRNNGNVYALYTKRENEDRWVPVYVGQRKSESLRERITQHLITKNDKTGSMLEAVKTAVASGNKIALSYIKITPESLRLYVEETIISKKKKKLPWNTHG